MARWIHITKAPFDYKFPDRTALIAYTENGDFFVKDEVADYAVAKGFAGEGKLNAKSRSSKGKSPRKAKRAKVTADAAAPIPGSNASLAGTGVVADDRAAVRGAVDPAADER